MQYVIVRLDGWYVADRLNPTGASYTRHLQYAQRYASIEEAERNRCPGSESAPATIKPIIVDMCDHCDLQ